MDIDLSPQAATLEEYYSVGKGCTMIRATRHCRVTKHVFVINVDEDGWVKWKSGERIQFVWPDMSPDNREILMTGYTPAEWEAMFKKE